MGTLKILQVCYQHVAAKARTSHCDGTADGQGKHIIMSEPRMGSGFMVTSFELKNGLQLLALCNIYCGGGKVHTLHT